jgi:hypothetical protein
MEAYNKNEIDQILNSNLVIHWWNFGKKTLSFNGTVKEYLKQNKVKYSIKKSTSVAGYECLTFKVKFNVGALQNIAFQNTRFDDVIRMCLNINLSYLGDKSQYIYNSRTRTINF